MNIKVKHTKFNLSAIKRTVRTLYESMTNARLTAIGEEIAEAALEKFEKTTENWAGGANEPAMSAGHTPKIWPKPTFTIEAIKDDSFSLALRVVVESDLWHWLNEGTASHVSVGETFLPRIENRTTPGTLVVKDSAQYGEHLVHVREGQTIAGIDARRWTDVVADELNAEFSVKYPGIVIQVSAVKA